MGNGFSADQGSFQTHGKRDVSEAADTEQHDWSELAEAPITNQPTSLLSSSCKPYSDARNVGLRSSSFADDNELGDTTYSGTQLRGRESSRSTDDNQQRKRKKSSSSSTEDGNVRAADNGRRERRKKSSLDEARSSSTSTETRCRSQPTRMLAPVLALPIRMQKTRSQPTRMMAPALDLL